MVTRAATTTSSKTVGIRRHHGRHDNVNDINNRRDDVLMVLRRPQLASQGHVVIPQRKRLASYRPLLSVFIFYTCLWPYQPHLPCCCNQISTVIFCNDFATRADIFPRFLLYFGKRNKPVQDTNRSLSTLKDEAITQIVNFIHFTPHFGSQL